MKLCIHVCKIWMNTTKHDHIIHIMLIPRKCCTYLTHLDVAKSTLLHSVSQHESMHWFFFNPRNHLWAQLCLYLFKRSSYEKRGNCILKNKKLFMKWSLADSHKSKSNIKLTTKQITPKKSVKDIASHKAPRSKAENPTPHPPTKKKTHFSSPRLQQLHSKAMTQWGSAWLLELSLKYLSGCCLYKRPHHPKTNKTI